MHEEPIVYSPRDAIRAFLLGNLDNLVLDEFLIFKKMKKIVFKIAFSASVGSGHLYRCSRLSQKLKEKGCCYLFL